MEPAVSVTAASGSGTSDRRLLIALAIVAALLLSGFLWLFNFTDFF